MKSSINRRTLIKGAGIAATASAISSASPVFAAPAYLRQGGDITLEVWGGVPAENGPQEVCDAFTAASGIKVNYTRYVNDDTGNTQLDTALQGGTPIDAFFTYSVPRLGQRIAAGATLDLTPYIAADTDVKAWTDATEGIFTYQDKYYSLPTTIEPAFVFINQRLLEEAGAAVPAAGWTTDEFVALAEQLSSDNVFGMYGPPDTAAQKLGSDRWYKAGGAESNFDAPEFSEARVQHRNLIEAGTAFPHDEVLAQNLRAYAQTPFLTEQDALWVNSSFSLRFVSDKEQYPHDFLTTFAPLPVPAGVEAPYNSGGINNWLLGKADSENPDAVWEFIKYFLTDGAVPMLRAGKIPAYPGTEPSVIVEGILGPDRDTLYDVAAYEASVITPVVPLITDTITTGSAEISQIIQGLDDRFLIGEIEIEEWVTEAKSQSDAAIAAAAG
jgi:multiple sugar transport system substrate-binding protein